MDGAHVTSSGSARSVDALAGDSHDESLSFAQRDAVLDAAQPLVRDEEGLWFLLSGRLMSEAGASTEEAVRDELQRVLGYPPAGSPEPARVLHVLVDSPGGSLDSAFAVALYFSAYTDDVRVYVPRRAKSASTLLALGARSIVLSPFGELGPLDTQLPDPRNPAVTVSALDCYQSVDYVRKFGIVTIADVFTSLVESTGRRVAVRDLLDLSSHFALSAISPMLESVTALDFGGWGRSLRIGEHYARQLLRARMPEDAQADDIAERLVYGYTHHYFPIDHHEAKRIGLPVEVMSASLYDTTSRVVQACHGKRFAGFLCSAATAASAADASVRKTCGEGAKTGEDGHPRAEVFDE